MPYTPSPALLAALRRYRGARDRALGDADPASVISEKQPGAVRLGWNERGNGPRPCPTPGVNRREGSSCAGTRGEHPQGGDGAHRDGEGKR